MCASTAAATAEFIVEHLLSNSVLLLFVLYYQFMPSWVRLLMNKVMSDEYVVEQYFCFIPVIGWIWRMYIQVNIVSMATGGVVRLSMWLWLVSSDWSVFAGCSLSVNYVVVLWRNDWCWLLWLIIVYLLLYIICHYYYASCHACVSLYYWKMSRWKIWSHRMENVLYIFDFPSVGPTFLADRTG